MGVERTVVRWHALHQALLRDIERLEVQAQLASAITNGEVGSVDNRQEQDIRLELVKAREKLHLLGPCPKPMMG